VTGRLAMNSGSELEVYSLLHTLWCGDQKLINFWLSNPHVHLWYQTPRSAIRNGRIAEVQALVEDALRNIR
jgi:hypothetical protein